MIRRKQTPKEEHVSTAENEAPDEVEAPEKSETDPDVVGTTYARLGEALEKQGAETHRLLDASTERFIRSETRRVELEREVAELTRRVGDAVQTILRKDDQLRSQGAQIEKATEALTAADAALAARDEEIRELRSELAKPLDSRTIHVRQGVLELRVPLHTAKALLSSEPTWGAVLGAHLDEHDSGQLRSKLSAAVTQLDPAFRPTTGEVTIHVGVVQS